MIETREIKLDHLTPQTGNPNVLKGHAAVFNSPSHPLQIRGRKVTEYIRPNAFNRSLAEGADVVCTINHDVDKLLGRTSSGTLELRRDRDGLGFSIDLPDTTYAADLRNLVERRDITGASFMFEPVKESWNESRSERYVEDVNLVEVSIVSHPAYEKTNDLGFDFRSLNFLVAEMRAGKRISADTEEQIRNAIETLEMLLSGQSDAEDEGMEQMDEVMMQRSIPILRKRLELAEKQYSYLA